MSWKCALQVLLRLRSISYIDSCNTLAACFVYSALFLHHLVSSSQTIRRISSGAQDASWPLRLRWDPPQNPRTRQILFLVCLGGVPEKCEFALHEICLLLTRSGSPRLCFPAFCVLVYFGLLMALCTSSIPQVPSTSMVVSPSACLPSIKHLQPGKPTLSSTIPLTIAQRKVQHPSKYRRSRVPIWCFRLRGVDYH